jgi:hypothetical protein
MKKENALTLDSVRLSAERDCLLILDQTLLPGKTEILRLDTAEEIWEAIRMLRVRGAPAIGVRCGIRPGPYGLETGTADPDAFLIRFMELPRLFCHDAAHRSQPFPGAGPDGAHRAGQPFAIRSGDPGSSVC